MQMLVFDSTSVIMNNKAAATFAKTGKISKSSSSGLKSKKGGDMQLSPLPEQMARVSADLKRSIAKELKTKSPLTRSASSKSYRKSSEFNSPPTRSLSSKPSNKNSSEKPSSESSRDRKEKKKKKKKSVSESSLHKRSVSLDKAESDTSNHNSTFPLHNSDSNIGANTTSSPTNETVTSKSKKPKRRGSSKKSLTVSALIENHKSLGMSESNHTASTKTCDSTISTTASNTTESTSTKPSTATKKNKKRTDETSQYPEEEDSVPLTSAKASTKPKQIPAAPVASPTLSTPKRGRPALLSFESTVGKSVHISKTRQRRGSIENGSEEQQQHATLVSPPSAGGKKKSVLKAKREKQLLKLKLEQEEKQKELQSRQGSGSSSSTPSTTKTKIPAPKSQTKNEDYTIHDIMDIVSSANNPPKPRATKDVSSTSNSKNSSNKKSSSKKSDGGNRVQLDPDECSSQSSSCSIVSDGSYEKDDLMSQTSDNSDRMSLPENFSLDDKSFGEHSFSIDVESSPTKSPYACHLEDSYITDINNKDTSFKSTLCEAMASSMSALTETIEESPNPSKPLLAKAVPRKTLLKNPFSSSGKPPLRLVPKRTQSDVTSLKSLSSLTNNLLRVRLPGQRKPVTRQRSLTFNEKVRVKRIPCQAQVCQGDTKDLWFQPKEYDAIKRKTMALIRAVQDDQTGGVTYCTRGLERYFSVDAVQDKRNDAWDSVLDEQEAQRVNNESFNADRMSELYSQTTRLSSQEAIERGRLDEDAIARYTKKMRQNLRRTYSMPT